MFVYPVPRHHGYNHSELYQTQIENLFSLAISWKFSWLPLVQVQNSAGPQLAPFPLTHT